LKLSDLYPWKVGLLLRRYVKAHHVSRAALIAAGTAAAILFFVIGAAIRLLIGPVSLGPFAGTLANALAEALPGIAVKYDQVAVEWAREEGRVNLVILGTRIFDVDGRIIAQAPKAEVGLAAQPFLHGKIVVKSIALVGVQLTLVRTKDGGLRLGVEKDKHDSDILSRIADAINARSGNTSSLESFAVRNARLAFFDETTGLFVVSPRAYFLLTTAGANLDVKLDAAVEISGRPAHIVGEFVFPPRHGKVKGAISVTGFELGALAANSKTFTAVKDTALKVDFSASFVVEGTHLLSADFGAGARGAFVLPGIKDGTVHVRSLRTIGRYDAASGRLLLEDATIESDKIKGRLQGWVDLIAGKDGALADVRADMRLDKITLMLPGVFANPVPFQSVDLRGEWRPATRELVLDHLSVSGAPLALQVSGKVTLAEGRSPGLELTGTIAPIGVRDLVRYWPLVAAEGGRAWTDENMFAGTVGVTAFETHIPVGALDDPALPAGALSVTFTVNGGEINYIKGLTHLTGVQGSAKVTGDSFVADIPSARIGPLIVTSAKFTIPNLSVPGEAGDVTGRIQGTMPDVLALVNMPPLGYPARFGVKPADTKGTATLDLSVHIPMRKSLNVDQVNIGIKAVVSGFVMALGPHTQLTDGTISFAIDNNRLRAVGTTGIGDSASRLALDWTEDFNTANAITTKIAVKGSLDEQGRIGLGLHTKDFLKGPIGLGGTLTGHRGALQQANMTLDLTPATVTFDLIGVNKPAGFPTTARIAADFGPHSALASQTIRVTGPGIAATATTKFGADGGLILLQAPTVRAGPLDDFSLNVARSPAGVEIILRGHSLDGTRLAGHGSDGSAEELDEPFHINAKLDRLMLREGVAISSFALDVSGVADRPTSLSLTGALSKTANVSGAITATESGRRAVFTTSDMGLLSKGLFGFNSIRGGKLEFVATFPGRTIDAAKDQSMPDYQGKAVLKDFRVLDQPFLARLFTAGSLGGLANLMQGQGIAVDTLEVPFSSRNGVISVHDSRATGPALGITADGYIDRPKNSIALKGSLVPMFGINSVLGNIPLLGDLLTSKRGEGIIGMTYSVTGVADEPSVSVNPLSALAPGILRRIFEGKMPNASQAPSNSPKPVVPAPPPANVPATTSPATPTPKGQ
jgi:hypothetical protein